MALGIIKDGYKVELSIPLRGVDDNRWEDNSWIVGHLRHLADFIERQQPKIHSVGLKQNHYNSPELFLEVLLKEDWDEVD